MAKEPVQRAMVELATKLDSMSQELRKKPEERLVGVEPAVALEKAHLAAQAVSQQARAAFFLDLLACKVEDATACLADLETKCVIYHSWAKPLLACISPTARKVAAGPLAQVILLTQALLGKAASPGEAMRPADLGQLDAAVNELPQLPVRGTDAARGVLLRSEALVEDALQEVGTSIAEAMATDKVEGQGEDGEEDGEAEDEEGEEGELFAQPALSAPLQLLLEAALKLLKRARELGLPRLEAEDKSAGLVAACAQAASAQVDNLVCAMHEEDAHAVGGYATSLIKVRARAGLRGRRRGHLPGQG